MSFIFLYGRPGSGKTTLACSMTKLGYKVRVIDIDDKIRGMYNLKDLVDSGMVTVTPIKAKLTETDMKQAIMHPKLAHLKQPQGYLELCDIISELEEEAEKENPQVDEQVLVVDSITSMTEHIKRLICHVQGKSHFTYDEWAIILSNLEEFFYTMKGLLKIFKHVIIISQEMTERDEITGKVQCLPWIEGSMRGKVGKYFEELYHCSCEVPKVGSAIYKVLTKETDTYIGRTSRDLPTHAEADFSILFKDELSGEKQKKLNKLEELKKLKEKKNE